MNNDTRFWQMRVERLSDAQDFIRDEESKSIQQIQELIEWGWT
jgi:hypothetical protein